MREFAPTFQLAMRLRKQVRRQAREIVTKEQLLIVARQANTNLGRYVDEQAVIRAGLEDDVRRLTQERDDAVVWADLLYEMADPRLRGPHRTTVAGLRALRESAEFRGPRSAP
jgi:hypothetical protein